MTIESVVAVLGLLGIGDLVSGYFTLLWQRRSADLARKQEFKETRYKCIILLMHGYLDFERTLPELQKLGYAVTTREDLIALLQAARINAFLYASDNFIRSLGKFLNNPETPNLVNCALSMRTDLWGVRSTLSLADMQGVAEQQHAAAGASRRR